MKKKFDSSYSGPRMPPDIQRLAALSRMEADELLSGLNLILRALEIKGYKIRDWENKKRILREIRPLYQKIYFFASEPEKGGSDGH